MPLPREPTLEARELVAKTILVEQYLLPLLQHVEIPGGILRDFKQRWREATLAGKSLEALRTIARRHGLPTELPEDDLRRVILEEESS